MLNTKWPLAALIRKIVNGILFKSPRGGKQEGKKLADNNYLSVFVEVYLLMKKSDSVENLQSHCIHTQFHWSSGPPVCFPS
jgi:hypothetical protein